MSNSLRNWAGNVTFAARAVPQPKSVEEIQDIVRAATKVRVLGIGHSFNRIADTDDTLLSLRHLPRCIEIDAEARSVTIDGGATYSDISPVLHEAGFGLAAVASLPNITVAGAIATATHGSGDKNQNLSAAVRAITFVTANGDLVRLTRGDADFDGAVVNLGALGVMVELTLDIEPSADICQNVYLDLPVSAVLADFDAVMGRAYSVSMFTRWQGQVVDQLWVKALADAGTPLDSVLGARAATTPMHPIPDLDGSVCTGQLGMPGPWHERLFHFSIGNTASAGAELQSEFFVARKDAPAAFAALHAVQDQFSPALFISEVRSVAKDALWLSSAYEQDAIGFHCTWKPDMDAVMAGIKVIQAALAPFNPRPHWGKLYSMPAAEVLSRYPRMNDFKTLADRYDPTGTFRNDFVATLLSD